LLPPFTKHKDKDCYYAKKNGSLNQFREKVLPGEIVKNDENQKDCDICYMCMLHVGCVLV